MRLLASLAVATAFAACLPSFAQAKVHILVDLDNQTVHVEAKDKTFDWKVSSGASGYDTPTGSYGVLWTDKDHKSDEYDGAPMPNAIFFKPGFAIHGAYKSNWGHPASHGCVRLPVAKSAITAAARPQRRAMPAGGADDFYGYEEPASRAAPPPAYDGYARAPGDNLYLGYY